MRGHSRGDVTLPPAAPFLLLDSLTGAPHLSSFTVQSGETGARVPPTTPHGIAAHRAHTRTQAEQWSGPLLRLVTNNQTTTERAGATEERLI